jgi:hypothetical protein
MKKVRIAATSLMSLAVLNLDDSRGPPRKWAAL